MELEICCQFFLLTEQSVPTRENITDCVENTPYTHVLTGHSRNLSGRIRVSCCRGLTSRA